MAFSLINCHSTEYSQKIKKLLLYSSLFVQMFYYTENIYRWIVINQVTSILLTLALESKENRSTLIVFNVISFKIHLLLLHNCISLHHLVSQPSSIDGDWFW